ncbi:hypothetical protein CRG98_043555 [Punica granatum]|uniref:Thiolase N-terminal domain-containing protein n=1 Tax=Punica granatum TaxID=22663 RepID=A0A2I0HWJ9_PUNGR|nr:hypothetical protein CRG98_043555 [Punica granatum]
MAAFYAGIPETVPIRTVNRQCSSGLQAVVDVAASIKAGFYDIGIAAGLESMTVDAIGRVPNFNPRVKMFAQARDCLLPMGIISENVAQRYGVTRQEQDHAAHISFSITITIAIAISSYHHLHHHTSNFIISFSLSSSLLSSLSSSSSALHSIATFTPRPSWLLGINNPPHISAFPFFFLFICHSLSSSLIIILVSSHHCLSHLLPPSPSPSHCFLPHLRG